MSSVLTITTSRPVLSDSSRPAIENEIERLLAILDCLDGDPEAEPSLGWSTTHAIGTVDDREDDAGDAGEMDDDREWSLGWIECEDQRAISHGQSGDLEQDRVAA